MFGYSLIFQEYLPRIFYRYYTLRNQKKKKDSQCSKFTVQHVKFQNEQIIINATIKQKEGTDCIKV